MSRLARRSPLNAWIAKHAGLRTTAPIATRPFNSTSNPTATDSSDLIDDDGYLRFSTLHELATNAASVHANNPLFGTHSPSSNAFEYISYSDFDARVSHCRRVLLQLGVTPHSKVGIISNNRHEWATIAAAAYSLSVALVPMYEAQLPRDWTHILNDSGCCALFCSTEEVYLRAMKEALPSCNLVSEVLCLDAPVEEPNSFKGAMERAAEEMNGIGGLNDGRDNSVVAPTADDLANLIYTSGTTGKPKASHCLFRHLENWI